MIRNVIFDWSGTLVDDLPAVLRATNYVFNRAGLQEFTLERFRAEFCLPFKLFYDRHLPHIPLPQLEQWFHAAFREAQDVVAALPHAREFLEYCRARKFRTFVLSTIQRDHFAAQAALTGFSEFIDRPYLEVWDKREKIRELLEENDLQPEETIFIGDMQHDIETAHHGGILGCAVLTGYNRLEQLRAAEPDFIVEHLGELRRLFDTHERLAPAVLPEAQLPIATVGALIVNSTDQVLMIRTHKWSDLWGIPGGKIRQGEPSIDALVREVKEETALDVSDIEFVMVQDCIGSKEFYRDAHFILLNYTCRCAGNQDVTLNEEAQEFRWVTIEEALGMPLNTPTRCLIQAVRK